jgi:hypothetical protein
VNITWDSTFVLSAKVAIGELVCRGLFNLGDLLSRPAFNNSHISIIYNKLFSLTYCTITTG